MGRCPSNLILKFAKWCVLQLTAWKYRNELASYIQLHSTKDRLLPLRSASTEKVIDVQSLNSGVYLLEVITSNGTDVVRIVKN